MRQALKEKSDGPELPRPQVDRWPKRDVPRSMINPAAYNPRLMDAGGRKKLNQSLTKFGLVENLVWNEQTGHLIGGHQRLKDLDKRCNYPTKTPDYLVFCVVVNLPEKEERELNIILNNPSAQGQYDLQALFENFQAGADPFAAGFELPELEMMFGDDLAQLNLNLDVPEEDSSSMDGDIKEDIQKLRQRAKDAKAQKATAAHAQDRYLVIEYRSEKEKHGILKRFGLPGDTYSITGNQLWEILLEQAGEITDEQNKRPN